MIKNKFRCQVSKPWNAYTCVLQGIWKANFCGHEKEGHFHHENFFKRFKMSTHMIGPNYDNTIPLLWLKFIRDNPNPLQREIVPMVWTYLVETLSIALEKFLQW